MPDDPVSSNTLRARRPRRGGRSVFQFLVPCLAAFGGLVLIGIAAIVLRMDISGRLVADYVLGNAIPPLGREMPATAGAIPYSSDDIQIVGGMGMGLSCSLPGFVDTLAFPRGNRKDPIGLQMRQACSYHDYCYRHGAATYGYTQADCDYSLQAQAFRLCAFIESIEPGASNPEKESGCIRDARLVTLGVLVGGAGDFHTVDGNPAPIADAANRDDGKDNRSTFFEFDPYPVRSKEYTVFRIADAPSIPITGTPAAPVAPHTKAIYRFRIRPSGISVSYATYTADHDFSKYQPYAEIPGNPSYLTPAPLVIHSGSHRNGDNGADWFVWWQRVGDQNTTGRLLALAPGRADPEPRCFIMPEGCPEQKPHVIVAEIGNLADRKDDPNINQLQPADLYPKNNKEKEQELSLATLRPQNCYAVDGKDVGNAPCYVSVLIKPDAKMDWQPQEPLSLIDRFSPITTRTDNERYRNFAALPLMLYPPDAPDPVIIWTRRGNGKDRNGYDEGEYEKDASLRRATVDRGEKQDRQDRKDDKAKSKGTVFLSGFSEAHEPAFVIGRSTLHPILMSLTDVSAEKHASSIAMSQWALPMLTDNADVVEPPRIEKDKLQHCVPALEAEWLKRPPQIWSNKDGSALAVFAQLTPRFSSDRTIAALRLAILAIAPDGSCLAPIVPSPEFLLEKRNRPSTDGTPKAIETPSRAFARLNASPLLLGDFDGSGSIKVVVAQGPEDQEEPKNTTPYPICSLSSNGNCTPLHTRVGE